MDEFKRFRYDFFGEFLSQESNVDGKSSDESKSNKIPPQNETYHHQSSEKTGRGTEDSLMEFITDYFEGNVTEDFSELHYIQSVKENLGEQNHCNKSSSGQMNAFNYSSSSEMNTSNELFTSPETSLLHMTDHPSTDVSMNMEGVSNSDLLSSSQDQFRSSRRKSISYEIVFANSKEKDGKVKIHIIPNKKSQQPMNQGQLPAVSLSKPKNLLNEGDILRQENEWLRHRVRDLERKLRCIETESERVVGELSKIIERKNETISQLELQIAGVRITNTG